MRSLVEMLSGRPTVSLVIHRGGMGFIPERLLMMMIPVYIYTYTYNCELRLRSTPRYRLVCICFPTPGRGLPYGSGLGLSRCLGPGESFIHSFIHIIYSRILYCYIIFRALTLYLGLWDIVVFIWLFMALSRL